MSNRLTTTVSNVTMWLLILSASAGLASTAAAHEIPADVVIQTIIKAEGEHLDFVVRVPLAAMRDVNFPETDGGYLLVSAADDTLRSAATVWIGQEVSLYEGGRLLEDWVIESVRLSLPSDRSFDSYDNALRHLSDQRLPDDIDLVREQALLDVLIRYPIESDVADFSIAPKFARLGLQTTTVVRYVHTKDVERVFELSGDPGVVRLDPSWHHAFFRFVSSGVGHILDGPDHLLFVICLLIPFRRIRPLIAIITSFTVAHSITLISSAFGLVPNFLWFPPFIETLIALSIVYMALENIVGAQWQKRWVIAFAFGLVHGFGFSFALSETLQFAGGHLLVSLLAFNIGVEIGQLLIIVIAVPVLNFLLRNARVERIGIILLSAILAHSGWHWMSERGSELAAYSFQWPQIDLAFFAALIRWLMLLVVIGVVVWLMALVFRRFLLSSAATTTEKRG